MKPRLSDSFPWSQEEIGGFAIAAVLAPALFALVLAAVLPPEAGTMCDPYSIPSCSRRIPDPSYVSPWALGCMIFATILALNVSPVKKLPGPLQYLVCIGIGALVTSRADAKGVMLLVHAVVAGSAMFLMLRVNWWFWWDVPSRRSVGQRVVASICFTGLPILGLGLSVWRLVFGVGIHDVTTQFAQASDQTGRLLETIIEDPALAEHARRMEAIRMGQSGIGPGRKPSEAKATVSESI